MLRTWAEPIGGKLPHRVLPELVFAERMWSGDEQLALSVPNGPALFAPARPHARPEDAQSAAEWSEIAVALIVLQRHTHQQLTMPHGLSGSEALAIKSAAELVEKGTAEISWDQLRISGPVVPLQGGAAILVYQPLKITYDDATIEFDVTMQQECDAVEAVEVTAEYIVVRPQNGAPVRRTLVPRGDYDYRVMSRPLNSASNGAADLEHLTVPELRSLARERGLVGYSRLLKAQLIASLA